jgi:hypothetical protein
MGENWLRNGPKSAKPAWQAGSTGKIAPPMFFFQLLYHKKAAKTVF